jgi:hypothetical protein
MCGRPGHPETEWHRAPEKCHDGGGLMFSIGIGGRAIAAPPKSRARSASDGASPGGTCETGTLLPHNRAFLNHAEANPPWTA